MRKQRLFGFGTVLAAFLFTMTSINGDIVFAHGEAAVPTALHPQTQIGLPDARVGHKHGGTGVDMSPSFTVVTNPIGPYQAGLPLTLRFTVLDKLSMRQIKDFEEIHTKKLHLIIVSSDLEEFYHVHPALQSDGTFILKDFAFPREVFYTMVFDLSPKGSGGIVLYQAAHVGKSEWVLPALSATQFPVLEDGYRMELNTDPEMPKTVGNTELAFTLSDTETGRAITDIEPYLGAAAHLVMITPHEDSIDYIHVHPLGVYPEDPAKLATLRFGPIIKFETSFPRPGLYKGWLQIQRQGKNSILPFTVSVEKGFGLTRNQVAGIVHTVQMREERRAMVKFSLLTLFILGMMLLFYPRKPVPASVAETIQTQANETMKREA